MSVAPPFRPTPEQFEALRDTGCSIALNAGAGCGKTSVLTTRLLRHLEGDGLAKCPLHALITLTFTDKAARELRQRVRLACRQRLSETDRTDRRVWRRIMRGLEAAPIGTFHSFCGSLLRRFPIEAGVEPGFTIVEESFAPTLRDQALEKTIRRWLSEENPDFFKIAVEFGLIPTQNLLARLMLLRGYGEFETWANRSPDAIVDHWRQIWNSQWKPQVSRQIQKRLEASLQQLRAANCTHPRMCERVAVLENALTSLTENADPFPILPAIIENAAVKGVQKKHWASEEIFEQVKDDLADLREDLKRTLNDQWDDVTTTRAAETAGRLARLVVDALDEYDRSKREQGHLDFDDLLRKARALLDNPPESVQAWLNRHVGFVLVDEFQDTDSTQGAIVQSLTGGDYRNGRLFLVGDAKQSIYRFRGARPEILDQFRKAFPEPGRLHLTENFRSRPEILDFVNTLFDGAFPGSDPPLRVGSQELVRDGRVAVEFLWAHEPAGDGSGDRQARRTRVDDRRKLEAKWLARHLKSRLDAGWRVRDRATRLERNADAGDIVLLFRSLNDAAYYEAALAREGLDYHVIGGAAFYGQQEVLDVINLLSTIEDPFDGVALAATLRSPFACVSDEGLYWLATSSHGDLVLGLEHWAQIPGLSSEDRQRAGDFHRLLSHWRKRKDKIPIARLLDEAIDESGYETSLLAEFLGDRRRANVLKLVRLARRYDAQGGLALADFVARLRADYQDPPREDEAATTDEAGSAVQLMTIHQAKGREFPIVVVPDLNRDLPISRQPIQYRPELGPIVQPREDDSAIEVTEGGQSLGHLIARYTERQENQDEALCLFYVAVTRAMDALILSAGISPDEPPKSPAMVLLDERFDRVTGASRLPAPPGSEIPTVRVITSEPALNTPSARRAGQPTRHLAIARMIERAHADRRDSSERAANFNDRPRYLDLDPARYLDERQARIDQIVRAVLQAPDAKDPSTVPRLVERAARAQGPSGSPRLERQARDLILSWLGSPTFQEMRLARDARRSVSWSLSWPIVSDDDSCLIRGFADYVEESDSGHWRVLILSQSRSPDPLERLRLLGSMRCLIPSSLRAKARGYQVRLGSELSVIEHGAPDDRELERAFKDACSYLRSAGCQVNAPQLDTDSVTVTEEL